MKELLATIILILQMTKEPFRLWYCNDFIQSTISIQNSESGLLFGWKANLCVLGKNDATIYTDMDYLYKIMLEKILHKTTVIS